jgi:hypothetical protein
MQTRPTSAMVEQTGSAALQSFAVSHASVHW